MKQLILILVLSAAALFCWRHYNNHRAETLKKEALPIIEASSDVDKVPSVRDGTDLSKKAPAPVSPRETITNRPPVADARPVVSPPVAKKAPVRPAPRIGFPGRVEAVHDAELTFEAPGVIRLRLPNAEWDCGLRIVPETGTGMDLSHAKYLSMDIENLDPIRQTRLTLHLSSGAARGDSADHAVAIFAKNRSINTGTALNPGEKRTLRIELPHPFIYAVPHGAAGRRSLATDNITSIELKIQWPYELASRWLADCRISNFKLEGTPDRSQRVDPAKYCPFIDRYGQFIHGNWPEKVRSDKELVQDLVRERTALAGPPQTWDRFGGWAKGPRLKATGHFRTEKADGKWWLVTPEGRLFFSFGIDVTRDATDASDASRHPDWYGCEIPPDNKMDFARRNLERKFRKKNYLSDYYDFVLKRFDAWGINTIGNWSDGALTVKGRKPYVACVFERDPGVPSVPGLKFYDCFDPAFESAFLAAVKRRFVSDKALDKSRTDSMCIGYFIDNEMDFNGVVPKMMRAEYASCAAKRAFLDRAQRTYSDVETLNRAWGTACADWTAVHALTDLPAGEGFKKDRVDFESDWYTRYFTVCEKALRLIAPRKLYLGCRFVGFRQSAHLWKAAAEHCDVVTVNSYANSLYNVPTDLFKNTVERPILVGEFHFGVFDRGMFKAGLCPVIDQTERGRSLIRFVQGVASHPLLVGCHWFQYRDQPLIGRGDGEAYQIGFVDGCDRPYGPLCRAAREAGTKLYDYRVNGLGR